MNADQDTQEPSIKEIASEVALLDESGREKIRSLIRYCLANQAGCESSGEQFSDSLHLNPEDRQ